MKENRLRYPFCLYNLDMFKKTMTHTKQPLARTAAQKTIKTKETEAEENLRDMLAVYDSINKLCESLSRLSHVLQRKNMEAGIKGENQEYWH